MMALMPWRRFRRRHRPSCFRRRDARRSASSASITGSPSGRPHSDALFFAAMTTRGCASGERAASPRHPCAPTKTPRRRAGRGGRVSTTAPTTTRLDAARRASTSPSATSLLAEASTIRQRDASCARANAPTLRRHRRCAASRTPPAACGERALASTARLEREDPRACPARGGADPSRRQPVAVGALRQIGPRVCQQRRCGVACLSQPCGLQLRAGREKLAAAYRRTAATRPRPARPARAADISAADDTAAIGCASAAETAA